MAIPAAWMAGCCSPAGLARTLTAASSTPQLKLISDPAISLPPETQHCRRFRPERRMRQAQVLSRPAEEHCTAANCCRIRLGFSHPQRHAYVIDDGCSPAIYSLHSPQLGHFGPHYLRLPHSAAATRLSQSSIFDAKATADSPSYSVVCSLLPPMRLGPLASWPCIQDGERP